MKNAYPANDPNAIIASYCAFCVLNAQSRLVKDWKRIKNKC